VGDEHLVRKPAEGRHLLGSAYGASPGHVSLPVPEEQAARGVQVAYRRQPLFEPLVRGLLVPIHTLILAPRVTGSKRPHPNWRHSCFGTLGSFSPGPSCYVKSPSKAWRASCCGTARQDGTMLDVFEPERQPNVGKAVPMTGRPARGLFVR
jgi:hypothetical protein